MPVECPGKEGQVQEQQTAPASEEQRFEGEAPGETQKVQPKARPRHRLAHGHVRVDLQNSNRVRIQYEFQSKSTEFNEIKKTSTEFSEIQ